MGQQEGVVTIAEVMAIVTKSSSSQSMTGQSLQSPYTEWKDSFDDMIALDDVVSKGQAFTPLGDEPLQVRGSVHEGRSRSALLT